MPLPKNAQNDRARIDDRRAKVAALYLAGKSQQAIACVVGVSQMTVSKDLAHLRAEWRAAALDDFAAKQAEELAKLAHLEREAWEAWERSREDAGASSEKIVLVDAKKGLAVRPKGVLVKVVYRQTVRGRCGDPRFLEQVARYIEIRLRMFGLIDGPQVNVRRSK